LSGLESDTTYFFRAGSTSAFGFGPALETNDNNPSGEFSFKTRPDTEPDNVQPQIVVTPYASGITTTTAIIGWGTDKPSTSIVNYGLTTSYGQTASIIESYQTEHNIVLSGLEKDRVYHYKVSSRDTAGNTVSSEDFTFTTATEKDISPPLFTDTPTISAITHNSFTIEWKTNERSDSRVQFGTTSGWWGNYPSKHEVSDQVTHHKVTIMGLTKETEYYCRVGSVDISGNGPIVSQEISFRTAKEPDTTAPQIVSAPTVISMTKTTATIVWETDEPSNSQVQYSNPSSQTEGDAGSNDWGNYPLNKNDAEMVKRHIVTIRNLNEIAVYYFRVGSTDSSGNGPATDPKDNNPSVEVKFTNEIALDQTAPQFTIPPTVTSKTNSSITIEWATDEPSNSIIEYGEKSNSWGDYPEPNYFDPTGVINHRSVITGLKENTTYFLRVSGSDLSGNGPETSTEDNNPSVEISVTTDSEHDFLAPQIISPPTVIAKTNTVAIIEWGTDEPANSLVHYDTVSTSWDNYAYANNDSSMVTRHSIALTNLAPNTRYYFRVASIDEHGNGPAHSFETSFTTDAEPDSTVPVVILPPTATAFSDTTATIEWETDEPGNSIVQYRLLTPGESANLVWDAQANSIITDPYMVTRHSVTITGLMPSTRYQYRVGTTDAGGNGPSSNLDKNPDEKNNPFIVDTFITDIIKDEAAPKILADPVVSATDNRSAIIEWDTDEPSTSMIKYGSEDNLQDVGGTTWEKFPLDSFSTEMKTHHRITVTDLNPSTSYVFRVGSTDAFGNGPDLNWDPTNASVLGTFKTAPGPDEVAPLIEDVQVFFVTNKTALITWKTDEPGNSIIRYIGEDSAVGTSWSELTLSENDAELTRQHYVTLSGVQPNTKYLFRVGSLDAKGNGPFVNSNASNPGGLMDFTTEDGDDLTAPQISGVKVVSVSDKTAVIEWETDEPGNSQVQYSNPDPKLPVQTGSSNWGNYPLSENDAEMVTHHQVTLTGLVPAPDGLYYFRVSSTDASGNNHAISTLDKNPSNEYNFITKDADPPSIILFGNENHPDAYPKIDYTNAFIDITFDEANMKNAQGESYYSFSPPLNFSMPGLSIQEISNGKDYNTFRLFFKSIPPETIIHLSVTKDVTDADNYPVTPNTIILNDADQDELPDDWEVAWGLNPSSNDKNIGEGKLGDFDGDGNSNFTEFLNKTDPKSYTSFIKTPSRVVRSIPFYHIDEGDTQDVPINTAIGALVVDNASGINLTDNDSIRFTIDDGVNDAYDISLGDEDTVRTIKLMAKETTENISALWVVYDRTRETQSELQSYPFEARVHVTIEIKNNDGFIIRDDFYYQIETESVYEQRLSSENAGEVNTIDELDPDLIDSEFTYDTGLEVISGPLEHTKLIYNAEHPATPIFNLAAGRAEEAEPANSPADIVPPTVFTPPAKLIIPVPEAKSVNKLNLYMQEGNKWVRACDTSCSTDSNGFGWIVPGSRVNRNNSTPPTIEIKVYHTSAFHAGLVPSSPTPIVITEESERAEAECFIDSLR